MKDPSGYVEFRPSVWVPFALPSDVGPYTLWALKVKMVTTSWKDVAATAQELRDASISRVNPPVPVVPHDLPRNVAAFPKQLLTPDEILITETKPEELISSLASGRLTSAVVANAFLRRAGLAQKLVCHVFSVQSLTRPWFEP